MLQMHIFHDFMLSIFYLSETPLFSSCGLLGQLRRQPSPVVRHIRKLQQFGKIPIVVLTNKATLD